MNILRCGLLLLLTAGFSQAATLYHAPVKRSKTPLVRPASINKGKVLVLPATSLPRGAIIPPQRQALPALVSTPTPVATMQSYGQTGSVQPYSYP